MDFLLGKMRGLVAFNEYESVHGPFDFQEVVPVAPASTGWMERTTGFEPATLTLARRSRPSIW